MECLSFSEVYKNEKNEGRVAKTQFKLNTEKLKIMSNDPLVDEQDEFFDMVKFSQKAFKNLSEQEIKEMIEENPELDALTKPAPFDREMVSGFIDSETGVEINEKDLLDLMETNKKMAEQIE